MYLSINEEGWKVHTAANKGEILNIIISKKYGESYRFHAMVVFENKNKYRLVGGSVNKVDFHKSNVFGLEVSRAIIDSLR